MSDQSATKQPSRSDLEEVARANAFWIVGWGLATFMLAMLLGDLLGLRWLTTVIGALIALGKPALDYYDLRERHRDEIDDWLVEHGQLAQDPEREQLPIDDVSD